MKQELRCLTLHRPWGQCFIHLGKDVENRPWVPPPRYIGALVALHEGKHFNREGAIWIAHRFGRTFASKDVPDSRIIAVGRLTGHVTTSESPWFVGPYGWTFEDLRAIEPIACTGALGLWRPTDDIEARIRDLYARAA